MLELLYRSELMEIGEYSCYVRSVRDNNGLLTDDVIAKVLKIALTTIQNIRTVISTHPDWDDEDVAEEVLDLEDDN